MIDQDSLIEKKLRLRIVQAGTPLRIVAKVGGISNIKCLDWWNRRSHLPPEANYDQLFRFLELPSQASYASRLTEITATLSPACHSENPILPDRYSKDPLSYTSTSRHILEFIELQFGRPTYLEILFKLGVTEEYFKNISNKINIKFFEDLLVEYSLLCKGRPDYNLLSRALFLTVEGSSLSEHFYPCKSYKEAYEQIEASIPMFDHNFQYQFQIGHLGAEIITKPSDQLVESVKNKCYGSKELYEYRSILFGNMASLCHLPPAHIEVAKCISVGDTVSRYIVRYP